MKLLLVIPLLITLTLPSAAQNIVGRDHPELIPDSVAYMMILSAHSHFEPDKQEMRERLHTAIGFSQSDHNLYDAAMKNFRTEYDTLVNTYNSALGATARGDRNGRYLLQQALAKDRDDLVAKHVIQTMDQLSPDGRLKFNAFVQSQKANITMGGQK